MRCQSRLLARPVGVTIAHTHGAAGARDLGDNTIAQPYDTARTFDAAYHPERRREQVVVEIGKANRHPFSTRRTRRLTSQFAQDFILV